METFNILFTSSGRRVSLIQSFQTALKDLDLKGEIITTDHQKDAPTSFVANFHETVPRVTDPSYIKTLFKICEKYKIKLLIPLIDTELHLLSCHKEDFEARDVTLLVSSTVVTEICIDKKKTNLFFTEIGVNTPNLFDIDEILSNEDLNYPFIIKPAEGSSSLGVTKINNSKELRFFHNYIPDSIIQEYILGQEYTLDILVDFKGQVLSVVPRLRIETRAGEISKGLTVKNSALIAAGKKVVESLPGPVGCITVQCFLTPEDDIQFIEINPRFGGGFPLSFHAGANFPRWIIEMVLGNELHIKIDDWQENIIMLRYDEAIFSTKEMIE